MNHDQLQELARKVLAPMGVSTFEIQRLRGGGNNQSYLINTDSTSYFLKSYHQDSEDPRRRGYTEFNWLKTLWANESQVMPKPHGFIEEPGGSVGIYEFIKGEPIHPMQVGPELIKQATDFIVDVNKARHLEISKKLSPASEACFSYEDHWRTVDRRVQRLAQIQESAGPLFAQAKKFVLEKLTPLWRHLSEKRPAQYIEVLSSYDRILSPSDFGFHNALIGASGKVRFLDFEYAGWDDSAKLVCDFFNQVAGPVPTSFLPQFSESIGGLVQTDLRERVEVLFPLYQIKWTCILLNHFLPSDGRRKRFALQSDTEWEALLEKQLNMAVDKLDSVKA